MTAPAPGKKEKQPTYGPLGQIGAIIVLVLQFLCLFFMAIGVPYDVFKPRHPPGLCYSLWGSKKCGGSHAHATHDPFWRTCGVFEASMKAGSALGIISIGVMVITILVLFAYIFKIAMSKIVLLLFLFLGIVTSAVPFAVVAGLYQNSTCGVPKLKVNYKLAAGFAFLVVSFCLQIFSFVFMCFS